MLAALIIVFREVFEAGLIIGIVLAVTRTVPNRSRWIAGGVFAGVVGACLVAAFAGVLSQLFEGMGQELFNAAILGVAVVMLTWHNVWMARHGKEMAVELRAVGEAVASGSKSLFALAVVVGLAVLREGSEVVLFLYGVAASDGSSAIGLLLGGLAGLALGGAVCLLTYFGLLRIPPRALFATTTVLITLLAAGMAAQAVAFLARANWFTSLDTVAWDTGWLLSEDSILGRALHTLIGYTDQPTEMQLVIYAAVVVITFALMRLIGPWSPLKLWLLNRSWGARRLSALLKDRGQLANRRRWETAPPPHADVAVRPDGARCARESARAWAWRLRDADGSQVHLP